MKGDNYVPLDVILEQPATRLLRALRWFDWVYPYDLFGAAGIPDYPATVKNTERNSASNTIVRLVNRGLVERGAERSTDGYPLRITSAGRRELAAILRGKTARSNGQMRRRRAA